jgi:hypothetical protein
MANVKITDLTAIAGVDLASNDVLPIVDINVDQTKKVSISDLQVGISDANDFVTYTRLQANIDLVQDNVASVDTTTASATETRLNANLDVVQSNVTAQNSYITTNYTTLLLTDSVQDNVASAESNIIALTTNVNTVQSNVTAVETRRSDNTFFTYNTDSNVVINTANVEPSQNNIFSLGAPDKVWKDVYIGPGTLQIGAVSISALGEEGISITGASGEQANVTTPSQGGVANVSAELEGLQSRLSTNVTTFTNEDTALQSRLTTNVNIFTNEDTALQARIAANALVAASNDFATYSRLQANIDLVQDNVASVTVGTAADTETRLNANLDVVQDNVVAAEANVVLVRSNVDSLGSYSNTTFSTVANAAALASEIATLSTVDTATGTETRLNANLDITNDNVSSLTTTVDNFGTSSNSNAAALAAEDVALQSRLAANVTALQSRLATNVTAFTNEDAALQSRLTSNVNTLTTTVDNFGTSSNSNAVALAAEDVALQARIAANALVAASNDYITFTRLNANVDVVQDNVATLTTTVDNFGTSSNSNAAALASGIVASETRVNANLDITNDNIAAIIDGTTQFTGDVTMQQALTVSGNLYVVGAQVDLGISSAQIDDATLLLAANTPADAQLAADSGIVINRGQDANVFFGFASYGDHIDFIFTDAPADNVNHYAIAYIDVHANSFGAEGTHDPTYTAVHHADRPTTGFYFPTNQIVGTIGGAYKANITASGLEAVAVYSAGVELQANDSATLFSAYANDFATYTLINANVDVVQDNVATLTTTVDNFGTSSNANAVALAAEDVALQSRLSTNVTAFSNEDTALQARITANAATAASNDYITYTRLNANVDVVQDNVAQNATDITAVETRRTANIAGAVSTITTGNLTASRALASDGSGKVAVSDVTSTELGYLDGVTSAIQTQLNAKQATITGAATTIDDTNLTATRALVSDGSGKVSVSVVTSTELGYLDGVTSAIQTQLNAKQATITGAATTIDDTNLTASRALVSDGSGKVAVSAVTSTEIGHLDGVTSAIQTQLDSKSSTANAASLASEDAALQSRLSTNVTSFASELSTLSTVDTALQARITANAATAASNDYITYTRLNANIDVVSSNAAAVETRRVANIAGAVSTITTGNLTASRALASDGSGKVAVSAVTSTELGYLDGVTSAIQTQLDAKQATITGAATTIDDTNLTASRALVSDGSGKVAVSAVTSTELGYLDGVSSDIQNQLNSKLDSTSYTASDVLTKIKTVDGSGSGLDADLLDGQSSAYYAVESTRSTNAAALAAGIATKLNSSSYTASDVLTKIKTVDGSGSGLDADLLDGQSSAYYAVESTRSSNAAELAAAIAGVSGAGAFPTGDYGLLDAANAATDAFGSVTAGLTSFDMLTDPSGSLSTEDLGALT